jgi:sec-independent protein translocase protein TatA
MGIENPVHLLFIGVVALIVLGPRRLPELARALGKGVREFREAVGEGSATPPAQAAEPPMQAAEPGEPAVLTGPRAPGRRVDE